MRRAVVHCIGILASAVVFGLLVKTATSAKDSSVKQRLEQLRQLVDVLRVSYSKYCCSCRRLTV